MSVPPPDAPLAPERQSAPSYLPIRAGMVATVVAIVSLTGILVPNFWARETASTAAQGISQDWFDLVVLAPLLMLTALGIEMRSRAALVLLGGGLTFSVYTYAIYAFAVRFNALFLGYCAALGLSSYLLVAVVRRLRADGAPSTATSSQRVVAVALIVLALGFAGLWLSELVPALRDGLAPASVIDSGLLTNPVHVLDLALFLPAMLIAGVAVLRNQPLGFALAPMLLVFTALMAASLATLSVVMGASGLPASPASTIVFSALAAACVLLLVSVLRPSRAR